MQADHNVTSSTEFQRISELGRWAVRKPDMYPGSPSARAIAKKRKAKRQGDRLTTASVELARCASGSELLSAHANGAYAMPLRQRVKGLQLPSEELQRRMSRATWKLRGPRLVLCGWIAYAHVVLRLDGLVISHRELATLLELRDPSWVGELLHDLRAWGLIAADPVWVKHGKASSQRANLYRLTNVGAHVFGLDTVLRTGALPAPEPDTAPRIARARAGAHGPGKSPDHPESTPDKKPASREATSSQSTDVAPPIDGPCAAPAALAAGLPSALPGGSLCLPGLERVKARPAALPAGSIEPEKLDAAGTLGSAVDRVLPRDPADGARATRRRSDGSLREQERRDRERDRRRQDELHEQLERRDRERRELEQAPAPAPPADPADSWAQVAELALEQERRAELERYRVSLVRPEHMNKPRRPDPDVERLDVLETLERSCALRGLSLPVPIAAELAVLRGRRRS